MPRRRTPVPCLDCGTPTTNGSRCTRCTKTQQSARNRRRTWYHGNWQTTRAKVKAQHIADHGLTCPGWNRPAHPVATPADLTVDHVTNRTTTDGLTCLCRACNAAKG